MDNQSDTVSPAHISETWMIAGRNLSIEVRAPYTARYLEQTFEFVAYLPQFGRPQGVLVAVVGDDMNLITSLAKGLGAYCSKVKPEFYGDYDRQLFIETLIDWG
jgi:hypothetical protein